MHAQVANLIIPLRVSTEDEVGAGAGGRAGWGVRVVVVCFVAWGWIRDWMDGWTTCIVAYII